ncbi:unnamed protein product [Musa textilis]
MDGMAIADPRPSLMVTNDDGIDAPGLRFLVDLLVAAGRYRVLVCAPDSEQSGVGHGITWHRPLSAKRVEIMGATGFAVSGTRADCASLGISGKLFVGTIPDLVTLLLDPYCLIMLYVTEIFYSNRGYYYAPYAIC